MVSITVLIIAATCIVSYTAFNNQEIFDKLKYNPYMVFHRKEWFRLVSHALLHGDWMHLFVNMYVLYLFGDNENTEYLFEVHLGTSGAFYYFLLYFGGVLFAALPGLRKHKDNHYYNSVGASGAVAAVLFSFIILSPTRGMGLIFLPFSMPAFLFGILYLWYEYYMDKRSHDNIAHDAHYWGALFGVVFTIIVVPNSFSNFVLQVTEYIF